MRAYFRLPLFLKISAFSLLGGVVGVLLGPKAGELKPIADIVLQLLRMLATPLIFLSIVHSFLKANIGAKRVGRLVFLLASNSLLAIFIALILANLLHPGSHVPMPLRKVAPVSQVDPWQTLLANIPKSFVNPFASNDIVDIILLGVVLALALRAVRTPETDVRIAAIQGYAELGLQVILKMLHWLFELVPFAVFSVIARVVGVSGFGPLLNMIWFVLCVPAGLFLMFGVYIVRLKLGSWVSPRLFFTGAMDAFVLAFSTASSAATLPVTYECATKRIGIREESASLGIMVGGTFNHDGGALYEAMAALFVSQSLGHNLGLVQQITVVAMSMFASIGAAGIPEAGLVTMIAVFSAVHLPAEYIPLLLPLDWLLDRLRTTVNVAGDLAATCILDGKIPPPHVVLGTDAAG